MMETKIISFLNKTVKNTLVGEILTVYLCVNCCKKITIMIENDDKRIQNLLENMDIIRVGLHVDYLSINEDTQCEVCKNLGTRKVTSYKKKK